MSPSSGTDNPIMVDPRSGSDRLGNLLRARHQPVQFETLAFGDLAFWGAGPEGRPIRVGVEYKRLGDALQCMTDGRFAAVQLPGMIANYEVLILLLEGCFRPDREGLLELMHGEQRYWFKPKMGQRRFMYSEFNKWLCTLQFKAGVRLVSTANLAGSAVAAIDLYRWWTAGWETHKSCAALHSPLDTERVNIVRPSLVRRVASCMPGIGADRSAVVGRYFRSVFELVMADESEWQSLEGIGPKTAHEVVKAIRGESHGNGRK